MKMIFLRKEFEKIEEKNGKMGGGYSNKIGGHLTSLNFYIPIHIYNLITENTRASHSGNIHAPTLP